MFSCINCVWEGEILSETPQKGKCLVCGDNVIRKETHKQELIKQEAPVVKSKFDIDGDGDVDVDDFKLIVKKLTPKRRRGKK